MTTGHEIPRAPLPHVTGDGGLLRDLRTRGLAANVFNLTVGSGIFVLPAVAAADLGSAAPLVYLACGIAIALVVLSFAEAGTRVAASGGPYACAARAFGTFAGYQTGVLLYVGCQLLGAATVATVFVGSVDKLVPGAGSGIARAVVLGALCTAFAVANIRGVRAGARLVEWVTLAKLVPLIGLVVVGVFFIHPANLTWSATPDLRQISRCAIVVIFAFTGMEGALAASGEVHDPARTIPRALALALATILVLYLAVQGVAQGILGAARLALEPSAPLAATAAQIAGPLGREVLLAAAVASTFGFLTADALSSPRSLYALASDGTLPRVLARVHARFRTPHIAIVVHEILVFLLALAGTFRALVTLATVSILCVYLITCLAAIELRRRDVRECGVPLILPGGPVIPLAACLAVLWLLSGAEWREFVAVGVAVAIATVLYGIAVISRRAKGRRLGT